MAIENADILNKEIPQTSTETPAPAGVSASGELEIDSWMDQPFGDSEEDQVLVAGLGNVARAIARPITTAIGIGKANMGDAVPENLRFKNLPKTEDDFFIKVDVNEAIDRPIRVDGEKLDTPELRQDKIDELDSLLSQADYQDFEIPVSDEPTLVVRILEYAGLSIREGDVVKVASSMDNREAASEK